MTTDRLPDYADPPIVEVVCGVTFEPLNSVLMPYLGIFWESCRDEYPICREMPPIARIIERFDGQPTEPELLAFSLPRVWFLTREERGVIQIQRDRLLYNWKRVSKEDAYPRYTAVIKAFSNILAKYETFLETLNLGTINPVQYELTYSNHIPRGDLWSGVAEIGSIFPDLSWRDTASRVLIPLEAVNCSFSVRLPDDRSRLHVTVTNARRRDDGSEILRLDLLVRGMSEDLTRSSMRQWFDAAHEVIVRGFADFTSDRVQSDVWHRKDRNDVS